MKKKLYLITGATGHVGTVLVSVLLERHADIRALVLPQERQFAPEGVAVCAGDVTDADSLTRFFDVSGWEETTLIHCAALITIASRENARVWNVNVNGTDHVMQKAAEAGIQRVIHVSSVHAIPERPLNETISEVSFFSPDLVRGQYAKSKAAASQKVLEYARKGLNVSIVHPSGVIGPGDLRRKNHMIRTIQAMASGKIPCALKGGYDFVDSRDVASGILGCETGGERGECYILSGHYSSVLSLQNAVRGIVGKRPLRLEAPYGLVKRIAPAAERIAALLGQKQPILTPYSVETLHTNGNFSCEKAAKAFGYAPRPVHETLLASL